MAPSPPMSIGTGRTRAEVQSARLQEKIKSSVGISFEKARCAVSVSIPPQCIIYVYSFYELMVRLFALYKKIELCC